jgi:diaminopimelate decarboxylase
VTAPAVAGRGAAPTLPARVHPLVAAALADRALLADAVHRWDTPLNLLFPQVMAENVAAFRGVLDRHGVDGRIFYAHKANQSRCLAAAARGAGIGIDVASTGELARALEQGYPPDLVEATGPKGARFLDRLLVAGACVNVDNLWELSYLAERAADGGLVDRPVEVVLRLGGLRPARPGRFGVPPAEVGAALDVVTASGGALRLRGVGFHLDTGETRERVHAVGAALAVLERVWEAGLQPDVLDVGGGFRQAFVDDAGPADAYVRGLKAGLAGQGPALTWDGATLGYRVEGGAVTGAPVFHKYLAGVPGHHGLDELLGSPLPAHGGRSVAQVLQDCALTLWLEPGKALVDHAGVTLARVEVVTRTADGHTLVVLDLSRDKVCPADQEVLLDPLVLPDPTRAAPDGPASDGPASDGPASDGPASDGPASDGPASAGPVGVFFAGNLCLERDLVLQHRVHLPAVPRPGDLVAFVNTAAYQMDLSASRALLQPGPTRVVVHADGAGGFRTAPDGDDRP